MLPVLSNIDDVSSDLGFKWDLSYWVEASLLILHKAEFLKGAILEQYPNAELTFVLGLMPEHINDLFPHVVGKSLPRVKVLEIIFIIFLVFKMIVAPPGFTLCVIVR